MKFLKWIGFILGVLLLLPTFFVYIGGYHQDSILGKSIETIEKKNADEKIKKELVGILAKEIPSSYQEEALKAQTVMIRTYLARRQLGLIQKGQLRSLTEEEMKEGWREEYNDIYKLYEKAITDTQDQVLYYDDSLIEPVYHRASSGRTRSAVTVYGTDIPYLQPVESKGDNGIVTEVKLEKKQLIEKLKNAYPALVVEEAQLENQMQIVKKEEGDYIGSIQIGNVVIEGEAFKKLLDLPSSSFTMTVQGDKVIFTVRGIGHGVGLSQNGANEMAKEGKNYKEILAYYFKEVKIDTLEKE